MDHWRLLQFSKNLKEVARVQQIRDDLADFRLSTVFDEDHVLFPHVPTVEEDVVCIQTSLIFGRLDDLLQVSVGEKRCGVDLSVAGGNDYLTSIYSRLHFIRLTFSQQLSEIPL